MSIDVREVLQGMEGRITPSEAIGTLIEMQLSKLVRRPFYAQIKTFDDEIHEKDNQELIKSELRKFTFLILEFLMEATYQEPATIDEIIDFLKVTIAHVGNPWEFSESFIEKLGRELVRDVLLNEGRTYYYNPTPLTAPANRGNDVRILNQGKRRLENRNERTTYALSDSAFQFLYRKKEVDNYLQANLNFVVMMMYESVEKGNYDGVLRGVKDLEIILAQFTYVQIPDFILKMNEHFDQSYKEKCAISDDGYQNLKLTLQKVQEIRQIIGNKRQLNIEHEIQGLVSVKSKKYAENKKKLAELEGRINHLLHAFTYAFSAIQELNQEYERLFDQYQVKTAYEYLDVQDDLFPFLTNESLLQKAHTLRSLMSIFETPAPIKEDTFERLITPKRMRKSRVKADTNIFDEEMDVEYLKREAQIRQQQEEKEMKRIHLIKELILFVTPHERCTLSDYLTQLKETDVETYLDYLAAESDDLFYQTLLYDVYRKDLYIPKGLDLDEMKKTQDMSASLVEAVQTDVRFKGLRGCLLQTDLIRSESGEVEMLHPGFPNFQFKLIEE